MCALYLFQDLPGKPPALKPLMRGDEPVRRPAGHHPPCRYDSTPCPKGTPENPKSLSARNRKVLDHYRECEATGQFPNDAIVRQNAAIIRETLRVLDNERQQMLAVIAGGGKIVR